MVLQTLTSEQRCWARRAPRASPPAPAASGAGCCALDGSSRKLAVKRGNLQLVDEVQREPKTLERHHQLLAEFDGSRDPDTLALYYHSRDKAFDAYNAQEYTSQLLRYYQHNSRVVCVSPRRIRGNDYSLIQLRHDDDERNSLCELAFQCQRSFCGVSILVGGTRASPIHRRRAVSPPQGLCPLVLAP